MEQKPKIIRYSQIECLKLDEKAAKMGVTVTDYPRFRKWRFNDNIATAVLAGEALLGWIIAVLVIMGV